MKKDPELEWPSLLKDRVILASDLVAQPIRELALPPAHIRTEMEDCDFNDYSSGREYSFGKAKILIRSGNCRLPLFLS